MSRWLKEAPDWFKIRTRFLRKVLRRVGELLASADSATGAALLHSLSRLAGAGQVNVEA
eukprot:gene11594-11738_t